MSAVLDAIAANQPVTAWAIPVAAFVLSVAAFILGQRERGKSAHLDYVNELEKRIEECEDDRKDLRNQLEQLRGRHEELRETNLSLLIRLAKAEGVSP